MDFDKWTEIFETLRKNKLRTFLTSFSVAWGIFMLIMLLGFGNGLQNGAREEFQKDAVNSLWVNSGKTSVAYKGMQPGRRIWFTNEDYELIKNTVTDVVNVTTRNNVWDVGNITYKNETSTFDVLSCNAGYRYLENLELLGGRFINDDDVDEARKVVVISDMVKKQLFKDQNALGEYIGIGGIPFRVIGIFTDSGGEWDQRRMYIPISTGQKVFKQINRVQQISMNTLTLDTASSRKAEDYIRKLLSERHNVAPHDFAAIRIHNNVEEYLKFTGLFRNIRLFVWAVGILTVIAGIVGVGNIMTISVKERTREIGIRKAMGATPFSIVRMVMQEAVLITFVSGYFGLIFGVGLLELINFGVEKAAMDIGFFRNPGVDFMTALSATGILVLAGSIAGLIPAVKAASIKPIAAIREE
ncbi:MAG TPA: ABC transporter permease [Chitinophagales bacterium]|nr:ABC transporter permease [Chitinophagales bacterium]